MDTSNSGTSEPLAANVKSEVKSKHFVVLANDEAVTLSDADVRRLSWFPEEIVPSLIFQHHKDLYFPQPPLPEGVAYAKLIATTSAALHGERIVYLGIMDILEPKQLHHVIWQHGGVVEPRLSADVTCVILGHYTQMFNVRAIDFGTAAAVAVCSENEFLQVLVQSLAKGISNVLEDGKICGVRQRLLEILADRKHSVIIREGKLPPDDKLENFTIRAVSAFDMAKYTYKSLPLEAQPVSRKTYLADRESLLASDLSHEIDFPSRLEAWARLKDDRLAAEQAAIDEANGGPPTRVAPRKKPETKKATIKRLEFEKSERQRHLDMQRTFWAREDTKEILTEIGYDVEETKKRFLDPLENGWVEMGEEVDKIAATTNLKPTVERPKQAAPDRKGKRKAVEIMEEGKTDVDDEKKETPSQSTSKKSTVQKVAPRSRKRVRDTLGDGESIAGETSQRKSSKMDVDK